MFKVLMVLLTAVTLLAGCASSQMKARKEQRDKAAQSSKIYCDFVNGELYPDVEVMLNLEMSKKCDSEKTFSISQYKTSNENNGIVFCCSMIDKVDAALRTEPPKKATAPANSEKATPAKSDELGD
jgi:hypothetical protein